MPYADLTADPNQPLKDSERIAEACRELHELHLRHGFFDKRGFWFPNDPAACVELPWSRDG